MKFAQTINNPKGLFNMDYVKIHDIFISHFKKTTPRERLKLRHPEDARNFNDYLYTELHHITPRSLGGDDSPDNLVRLLPEEHIFIHFLRYKAFDKREDMLAVRLCLNGGKFNKTRQKLTYGSASLSKDIRQGYALVRQHSAEFRKKHGWQTPDGIKRISEARKGKIPVVDAKTGEVMGACTKDHPKYMSGEWVHHTKGFLSVIEKSTGKKIRISSQEYQANKHLYSTINSQKGEKNGRYSGLTDEDLVGNAIIFYKDLKRLPSWHELIEYCGDNNIKMIKSFTKSHFRFGGGGVKAFYAAVEQATGSQYTRDKNGGVRIAPADKKYKNQFGEFYVGNYKSR